MVERISGFVIFLLSFYEWYASVNYFKTFKAHADKKSSPFMLIALWSGFLFGAILFAMGIVLMLKLM